MFCHLAPGLISLVARAGKAARIAAEVQKCEQVRIQLIALIAEQVKVLGDTFTIRLKIDDLMIRVDFFNHHMLCTQNCYCSAHLRKQESTSRERTGAEGRQNFWTSQAET